MEQVKQEVEFIKRYCRLVKVGAVDKNFAEEICSQALEKYNNYARIKARKTGVRFKRAYFNDFMMVA